MKEKETGDSAFNLLLREMATDSTAVDSGTVRDSDDIFLLKPGSGQRLNRRVPCKIVSGKLRRDDGANKGQRRYLKWFDIWVFEFVDESSSVQFSSVSFNVSGVRD
jgi:hypothetical protein